MSPLKKVLFVDDDTNILDGLRRMLHSMRHEWGMGFAKSGYEALELLAKEHYDVIVTDMEMPEMNGLSLLKEVERQYPEVIRIVLSGQIDRETILKSVNPIHQYLSKPCDKETLVSTISSVFLFNQIINNNEIKSLVTKLETLPSYPTHFNNLLKELQSPDISLKRIGEIITKDVGMSAKILQLVNSAFFGVRRHISSPQHAVNLLGLGIVRALVISTHIFRIFEQIKSKVLSFDILWYHSFQVGKIANLIAKSELSSQKLVDFAFISGLLHDIGKLVLSTVLSDEYAVTFDHAKKHHLPLFQSEIEIIGLTHEQVGAYLLSLWGFSIDTVVAVAFHHNPSRYISNTIHPLTVLYIANILEHKTYPDSSLSNLYKMNTDYLGKLDLSDKISVWEKNIREEILNELNNK